MLKKYRMGIYLITAALTSLIFINPVFAKEKINSVSVRFEAEDFDEENIPTIEATTKGKHYSVNEMERAYEYFRNESTYDENSNVYVVELTAEDGYYFNITKSANIKLNGAGAEFIKASRQDNGQTLILTVRLTSVDAFVGDVNEAKWLDTGKGNWTEAPGAYLYQVAIINSKGKVKYAETAGTTYDFRPFMQKEGTYEFKVRPQSREGKKRDWVSAGYFTVTSELAAQNAATFEVKCNSYFIGEEKTPANQIKEYVNTGWQTTENGQKWYRNTDGSYPQNVWWQEGEQWYYFDSDGYMTANGFVEWDGETYYFDGNGHLLKNGTVPDGKKNE